MFGTSVFLRLFFGYCGIATVPSGRRLSNVLERRLNMA